MCNVQKIICYKASIMHSQTNSHQIYLQSLRTQLSPLFLDLGQACLNLLSDSNIFCNGQMVKRGEPLPCYLQDPK